MEPITGPFQLNADTWDRCDDLALFGRYFNDGDFCPDPPGERKLRLMVAAALRAVWPRLAPEIQAVVAGIEEHADGDGFATDPLNGPGKPREVLEVWLDENGALSALDIAAGWGAAWYASDLSSLAEEINDIPLWVWLIQGVTNAEENGSPDALPLFRDLFPNPFDPVPFDPAWRSGTAVALARGIYQAHDWGRMPILADALEDAGCADARVLDHCRGPGPHARGCWVLDALLGRS